MHAVVIPVKFNDLAAAKAELDGLVAQVSGRPGFVAGYWVELSREKGTAMIVFDTASGAEALADFARSQPSGAVTTEAIEVGQVLAHA